MTHKSAESAPAGRARLSLNAAAARIAAAYGFTIRFRETLEPGNGRIEIQWALDKTSSGDTGWYLELCCQPPVFAGHGGWSGWFQIVDWRGQQEVAKYLVGFDQGLAGRKACPLTRQKFCEWAENLTQTSPGTKSVAALNESEPHQEIGHA